MKTRGSISPRAASSLALRVALAGLLLLAALPLGSAPALTKATIVIDGSFDDWVPVKADSENMVQDTVIPNDPDTPGQPDRDVQYVGSTWDDDYLYLYWRRTASGTKAITFAAYIDRGNDGSLNADDMVAWFTVGNGQPHAQAPGSAGLLWYEPASPSGDDTMGADGVSPLGTAWKLDVGAPATTEAYLSSTGIEIEARVPWSALDLDPGSPIRMHFCAANGAKFMPPPDGQIEDNVGGILSLLHRGVSVTPDGEGAAAASSTASYAHTVTNSGNTTETFDLDAASGSGWAAGVYDSSGIVPVTSVTLGPGESCAIVAKVTVPPTAPAGATDVMQVTATCAADPTKTGTATDTTRVGSLTVTPDHSSTLATASVWLYPHTVANHTGATQTIVLSAQSSAGWPVEIRDAGGVSTLATITLAPGETRDITARVSVPPTAAVGAQDVTTVRAVLTSDPFTLANARDTTTVGARLAIAPDNRGSTGPATVMSYEHVITNSTVSTVVVSLSAVSSAGWAYRFYDTDGVTQVTTVAVGPAGGTRTVYIRVSVPPGVAEGVVDTTTVTATGGGSTATAVDVTTIHQLVLYDTPGRTRESTTFTLGSTAYAQGAGLTPKSNVRFQWVDPSNGVVYTGPLTEVDSNGLAFGDYTFALGAPLGTWSCRLLDAGGATLRTVPFTLTVKGTIAGLTASDASDPGQLVYIDTTVLDSGAATITASTATYVVWWDDDADGRFDAGDTYIDAGGAPHAWDGVAAVSTHQTAVPALTPGETWSETDPGWSVANTSFPYRGTYRVTETWTTSGGEIIDTKTTSFYSVPVLGALLVLFVGLLLAPLAWLLRRKRKWLAHYVLSAFGFTVLGALFLQQTGAEALVASWENAQVAWLAGILGVPVRAAVGSLMIANPAGWSLLRIGIECSAVIEMTVLVGLIGFHPGLPTRRRAALIGAGVAATYVVNLARLVIIVAIAARFGPGSLFVAHAVVGRTFFFVCVVALYWWLLTRTTLRRLREELRAA